MRIQRRLLCILGLCLFYVSFANAQTNSPTKAPETKSLEDKFFKNILRDQKAIWTSPLQLQRHDIKWMLPSGLGLGALITTDRITGDEMAEVDGQLKASRAISYIGSTYAVGAFSGALYLIGRHSNNTRARETGLLSAEALIDSIIVVGALKGISERARPLTGRDRSEFFDGGSSFPSGHSIQIWSVATVVAHEYKESHAIQVAAYGLASAVSVARFTAQKHYLSDILVGSALGFGIGRYVYKAHHRESQAVDGTERVNSSSWPEIVPLYSRRTSQYGVELTWSF